MTRVIDGLPGNSIDSAHHVQLAFDPSSERAAPDGLRHWGEAVLPSL